MTKLLCWSICALLATTSLQASESTNGIFDTLLKEGEIHLSFRYRYEFVDQDCCDPSQAPGTEYDEDAHASSVRSRLTLKSGSVFDTQLMLEIDSTAQLALRGGSATLSLVTSATSRAQLVAENSINTSSKRANHIPLAFVIHAFSSGKAVR